MEERDILLVEDNPDHAELAMRCLEEHEIANQVRHVDNGEAALKFLRAVDAGEESRPDLILLDLRLPKVDGLEVLEEIKGNAVWREIPVVVLTTSRAEPDVEKAYSLHANSYLVKPIDFSELSKLVSDMVTYWLSWNRKPRPQDT